MSDNIVNEVITDADTILQADNNIETFLEIKYNHTPMSLTKEEARELSQKGLNYDKLLERYNALEGGSFEGADKNQDSSGELTVFFDKYPNISPKELPEDVLSEYSMGTPLHIAYEKHQIKSTLNDAKAELSGIMDELLKLKVNDANAQSSVGSIANGGLTASEFYTEQELSALSSDELSKNLDKALRSMSYHSKNK